MIVVWIAAAIITLWLICEIVVRVICDLPVKTDFYSSIPRSQIPEMQKRWGVQVSFGDTWAHLGWVADPKKERYSVWRKQPDGSFIRLGKTRYGGYLVKALLPETEYTFRVASASGTFDHTVTVCTGKAQLRAAYKPVIDGGLHVLFRPQKCGSYMNDHTVYQSADGKWHVAGITAFGEGDYSKEKYFAHGESGVFPFAEGVTMAEQPPLADEGHLAWAPHMVRANGQFYMWYSPHKAYCQTSPDGTAWREAPELGFWPAFPQFRDPMVFQVAENQWLMVATARHGYYSTVDIYQSFDASHWQYIRSALKTGLGCERAAPQASTESPFVFSYQGGYYLSVTYNNNSFFLDAILLQMKVWRNKESYNDTLVFQSQTPYDFGMYRGRRRSSSLVGTLRTHAPEYVEHEGQWYVTSCGWPWVATVTHGEAGWARLGFEKAKGQR